MNYKLDHQGVHVQVPKEVLLLLNVADIYHELIQNNPEKLDSCLIMRFHCRFKSVLKLKNFLEDFDLMRVLVYSYVAPS